MQRAPQLFIFAVVDGKAVGIVYRGTKIVDLDAVVWPEEENARHRCEPDVFEVYPRIDPRLHVEYGGAARPDGEAIGRRRTFAVEQGVHHDRTGVCGRLLDPE